MQERKQTPTAMTNPNLTIMKNLTASGKSVYWTLNDGTQVVCRVARKGTGVALANLVNSGETEFGLEYVPSHHAYYITHDGQRVCLASKKSFNLLINYLQNHESYNNSIPLQSSIRLQSSSESVCTEYNHSDSVLPSTPQRSGDDRCQAQSSSAISIITSSISKESDSIESESDFIERLEQYDKQLKSRVARGEQLAGSECELTRGIGQLTIGVANLQREQLEIALDQRRIRDDQRRLRDGQQRLGSQMLEIGAGQSDVAEQLISVFAALEGPRYSELTQEIARKEKEKLQAHFNL